MKAEDLVRLVDKSGLVGLQGELGISRQRAESLDVEARRMVAGGFSDQEVGRSLTASAIARQQAIRPTTAPTMNPETARMLAALDRFEAGPTPDQIASQLDAARRAEVERRNRIGAAECAAYAQKLKRGGYAGWTGGQR